MSDELKIEKRGHAMWLTIDRPAQQARALGDQRGMHLFPIEMGIADDLVARVHVLAHQVAHGAQRERQDRAIASIEQDPFVRDVVDLFDASIDESTIKPV